MRWAAVLILLHLFFPRVAEASDAGLTPREATAIERISFGLSMAVLLGSAAESATRRPASAKPFFLAALFAIGSYGMVRGLSWESPLPGLLDNPLFAVMLFLIWVVVSLPELLRIGSGRQVCGFERCFVLACTTLLAGFFGFISHERDVFLIDFYFLAHYLTVVLSWGVGLLLTAIRLGLQLQDSERKPIPNPSGRGIDEPL